MTVVGPPVMHLSCWCLRRLPNREGYVHALLVVVYG